MVTRSIRPRGSGRRSRLDMSNGSRRWHDRNQTIHAGEDAVPRAGSCAPDDPDARSADGPTDVGWLVENGDLIRYSRWQTQTGVSPLLGREMSDSRRCGVAFGRRPRRHARHNNPQQGLTTGHGFRPDHRDHHGEGHQQRLPGNSRERRPDALRRWTIGQYCLLEHIPSRTCNFLRAAGSHPNRHHTLKEVPIGECSYPTQSSG